MQPFPERKATRALKFADQIRERIREGKLRPGDQLPSFAQMKETYGLGQATIERTYNILEEERLIVRIANRGIFVTEPLVPRQDKVIGILARLDAASTAFDLHLIAGIQQVARKAGVEIMLLHPDNEISWGKLDGLLRLQLPGHIRVAAPPGLPTVQLLLNAPGELSVCADDYDGCRAAVKHLLNLGHRRIAYLTLRDAVSQIRLNAYHDELAAHGISPARSWVRDLREFREDYQPFEELGYQQMKLWLEGNWDHHDFTAIMTQNDETAAGVIRALEDTGLNVPGDVSVVGFDGTEVADYLRPRLTTVVLPLMEIGRRGAALLLETIAQAEQPGPAKPTGRSKTITLPVVLRVAQSTQAVKNSAQA